MDHPYGDLVRNLSKPNNGNALQSSTTDSNSNNSNNSNNDNDVRRASPASTEGGRGGRNRGRSKTQKPVDTKITAANATANANAAAAKVEATPRPRKDRNNLRNSNGSRTNRTNGGSQPRKPQPKTTTEEFKSPRQHTHTPSTVPSNGVTKSSFANKSRRKKKGPFPPHDTYDHCMARYASASPSLVRGMIRVLPGRHAAAFVTCDRGSTGVHDVLLPTSMEQNRALHGDMVFVELMDPEDEDEKKQEPDDAPPNLVTIDDALTAKVAAVTFQNDDVYTTWQDDTTQMHLWNPTVKVRRAPDFTAAKLDDAIPQRQGRVVHVIAPNIQASSELNPSDDRKIASKKTIVGLLTTMTRGDGTPMYLLTPAKKSLPQFLTPPFFKPLEGDDGMYRAEYVYGSWKEGHNWPPCTNVQFIGRSCNVEDETMALLAEHGVDHGEFEGPVLKDVQDVVASGLIHPSNNSEDLGWKPTPDMYEGRRDYRSQRIFTIDPTTARDLDDALHITALPNGLVEIGVHIADVSFFVQPNHPVDAEAQRRATTVYLVDRVIPMLPRPLCEVACSLNENVERLAFSCVWTMNMDGTLAGGKNGDVWYGRTVIKSCARLDYATAQNIIDNKVGNGESANDMDGTLWPASRRPTGDHTVDQVAADVRLMHKVAMARRKLRFKNGAIALQSVKMTFQLDADGETPNLCAPYPIRDSNKLIEEYMLLANYLVAQRLITHAGALACLRHHPPPLMDGLQSVVQIAMESQGFNIDLTSSQSLQQSLSRLGRECDDELILQCITEMLMLPMKPAQYFAAGQFSEEEWKHFALNIPYYTHFTSPIRRYPDVIVHRLLQATIDGTVDEFHWDQHSIQAICTHCNEKKLASKYASDRSDRVFLSLFLKKRPIKATMGVVLSVGDKTFTVYVPSIGVSAKVFLDEHADMVTAEPYTHKVGRVEGGEKRIRLTRIGKKGSWNKIDIKVFCKLCVNVTCKEKPPIDVKLMLEGPWMEG